MRISSDSRENHGGEGAKTAFAITKTQLRSCEAIRVTLGEGDAQG